MEKRPDNIFSVFDKMLSQEEKERMLNQRAMTIWLTGLLGSGKTTVAIGLEQKLHQLEAPKCPDVEIKTVLQSVEDLFDKILPIIKYD